MLFFAEMWERFSYNPCRTGRTPNGEAVMKRLFIIAMLVMSNAAFGASPAPAANDVDAIIKSLEDSGALDRAVERAIGRFVSRQQEAQRKQQADAAAQQQVLAKNARVPDAKRDHLLGDPAAEATIIEYSDFECPYCKSFHGVPQQVATRLGGKVNVIWRHFPLDFHNPAAQKEAEASECAAKVGGNDAFWKYADGIMGRTASNGKGLPGEGNPLVSLARELNLDVASFQKCLDSGDARAQIADDQKDAIGAGVTGTPGVIIRNNKTGKTLALGGAVPVEMLEARAREILSAQ